MKLDQIPKHDPFQAPDGYFDKLPGVVQSRIDVARPNQSRVYVSMAFRYALPAVALVVAGIFLFRTQNTTNVSVETQLASIDEAALELYLEGSDNNADELIETVNLSAEDLRELENTIYASYDLTDSNADGLLDVYEVEPVNDSVQ